MQDPIWDRTQQAKKGRDGCRVPLPWAAEGATFGFGGELAWLPQPDEFGTVAVSSQSGEDDSTLELYREAMRLRRQLQTGEELDWVPTEHPQVLHFVRPNGWHCITNFGIEAVALPNLVLRLSTARLREGRLPGEATAWLSEPPG